MKIAQIIVVSREGYRLYGGRPDDNGYYVAYEKPASKGASKQGEPSLLDVVEDFCQDDVPASDKAETLLGIILSPSFTEDERNQLLGHIAEAGYTNQRVYDYDRDIAKTIRGQKFALVLSADNDDLLASIRETKTGRELAQTKVQDAGADPRVTVLANKMWEKLLIDRPYLNKEKDLPAVKAMARDFLLSGKSELNDQIYLEGYTCDIFVRRKDAQIDNTIDHGGNSILTSIGTFADKNKLNKAETMLVLSTGISGNPYFKNIFNGFTNDLMEVDKKMHGQLLSAIINDLMGNEAEGIVSGRLPLSHIKTTPHENAIDFKITFPEGITEIEVLRDGQPNRTITTSAFTDSGLESEKEYVYSFIMVVTDETGYKKKSEETRKAVYTTTIQADAPVLKMKESEDKVELAWDAPARGETKLFVSPTPFGYHSNDRIDMRQFNQSTVSSLDCHYAVLKNFCGERYFLPVTIIDQVGVAGEPCRVTSMVPPTGFRVDATNVAHVKAIWSWDGVTGVRVIWGAGDGNDQWKDITNDGGTPAELEINIPARLLTFTVRICSLHKTADGQLLTSRETRMNVTIKPISVDFLGVKSKATFFSHKNEYELTVRAEGEPPCDLCLLIEEGSVPLDLTNFRSHLTIPHQDLADGTEKKYTFKYERRNKGRSLYFRLIGADLNMPLRVNSETRQL